MQAGVHGEEQTSAGPAEGAEDRDRVSEVGGAAANCNLYPLEIVLNTQGEAASVAHFSHMRERLGAHCRPSSIIQGLDLGAVATTP